MPAPKTREKVCGPDHAEVPAIMHMVAGARSALGQHEEAVALLERVLKIGVLEHANVADALAFIEHESLGGERVPCFSENTMRFTGTHEPCPSPCGAPRGVGGHPTKVHQESTLCTHSP